MASWLQNPSMAAKETLKTRYFNTRTQFPLVWTLTPDFIYTYTYLQICTLPARTLYVAYIRNPIRMLKCMNFNILNSSVLQDVSFWGQFVANGHMPNKLLCNKWLMSLLISPVSLPASCSKLTAPLKWMRLRIVICWESASSQPCISLGSLSQLKFTLGELR